MTGHPSSSPSSGPVRPYTHAYQFHDCIRFSDREVNGARPISAFPLYDQKTIDGLLAEIDILRAKGIPDPAQKPGASAESPQHVADYLFDQTSNLGAAITYTACLAMARHIQAGQAVREPAQGNPSTATNGDTHQAESNSVLVKALNDLHVWCEVEGCGDQAEIIKDAFIATGITEYRCANCDGAGEWDEGPLPATSSAQISPDYRHMICSDCEGKGTVSLLATRREGEAS